MHATGGTRRSLVWAMAVAVAVLIFPQAALAQNVAAAGRLVYPDGTPAAGLSVSLRSDFGSLTRVTDANGVFRFALNPRVIGTRVRVQASSGEWMFDTVVVIPRPGPSGVDLRTGTLHRMAGAAAPTATRPVAGSGSPLRPQLLAPGVMLREDGCEYWQATGTNRWTRVWCYRPINSRLAYQYYAMNGAALTTPIGVTDFSNPTWLVTAFIKPIASQRGVARHRRIGMLAVYIDGRGWVDPRTIAWNAPPPNVVGYPSGRGTNGIPPPAAIGIYSGARGSASGGLWVPVTPVRDRAAEARIWAGLDAQFKKYRAHVDSLSPDALLLEKKWADVNNEMVNMVLR